MVIPEIGPCKGCNKLRQLDGGVCHDCLTAPKRGRKWAERSHKCRTEPNFALAVYLKSPTIEGRQRFVNFYGFPPGADRAIGPIVRGIN